jgi:SnoaL-like domain
MSRDDDRQEIMNQLGRFARILDDRNWDATGDVFAQDVTFDYGNGQEKVGLSAMRAQFQQYLDGCGPSQHLLGSVMLTFEGDEAITSAYVQARHQGKGEKADRFLDTSGEYIDRWQCRDGRWLVVRRDARWFMNMGDPTALLEEGEEFEISPATSARAGS